DILLRPGDPAPASTTRADESSGMQRYHAHFGCCMQTTHNGKVVLATKQHSCDVTDSVAGSK
ncbi:hypothetical protein LPJ54_006156, partial [Coemansia sp. RSA 1824]